MNKNISISDQINTSYKSYAMYVLQSRGIPNFYDSLTPVQRLIVEYAPNKLDGTFGLVGEIIKSGQYHHGDDSLSKAISRLARSFGCSYSILNGDGFFGTQVEKRPAAARYTKVKLDTKIKEFINKNFDINEKNNDGGFDYLNVELPIGLLTHIMGIAVGYRTNILPRKLEDIKKYLEGSIKNIKPYFKDFEGKISSFERSNNAWLIEGCYDIDVKKKTIRIHDLPPVFKYDSFLNTLDNKLDLCGYDYRMENLTKTKCDVMIQIKNIKDPEFILLAEKLSSITKIIIREEVIFIKDGRVREFESVKEYLDNFKEQLELVRLKRCAKDLENNNEELAFLEAKLIFLKFMSEKKRTGKEVKDFLSKYKNAISTRLNSVNAVKINTDYIKETELDIKNIKLDIIKSKKLHSVQEKVYKDTAKKIKTENQLLEISRRNIKNALFEKTESIKIGDVGVFILDEDMLDETENDENGEI